jgi:hypothetical protein
VVLCVKAEVFKKDQLPVSLALDHREPHFRDHAPAARILGRSEATETPLEPLLDRAERIQRHG